MPSTSSRRSGIGTDWGTRLLSRESAEYEPQSYNNGAVWPFLTGFATLALYTHQRPDAAWAYLDATAQLAFLESRGYTPELLSGDRLRSLDPAVPHQLFSTSGFMSGFMRGLIGLREPPATDPDAPLTLEPRLPAGWDRVRLRRLRWRDAVYDVSLSRNDRGITVSVSNAGRPHPIVVTLAVPPGAEVDGHVSALRFSGGAATETKRVDVRPGIEIAALHAPLTPGDPPQRLRILSTRLDGRRYVVRLEGQRGRTYAARLWMPFAVEAIEGATITGRDSAAADVAVTFDGGPEEWVTREVVVSIGRRVR